MGWRIIFAANSSVMRLYLIVFSLSVLLFSSCRETRIHEHKEWAKYFEEYGIKDACVSFWDNNHESVHYYNKERCLERFSPASTFKIMNSLVALESGLAPDELYVIPWDSIDRGIPDWNRDMNMREAIKVSNVPYYQEIARRIGPARMYHYLDTVNYGNENIAGKIDEFWLNDTLQISADEQVGFVKRLYFAEHAMSERSQRIVKNMMLQEEDSTYKLYYKTGWSKRTQKQVFWVVGFAEKMVKVKEHKKSMNQSGVRMYPYFFALNFESPTGDTAQNWPQVRLEIMRKVFQDRKVIPN
jgi:beta-lactamase class D